MYRVFLIPTGELSPKELWLDAHAVHETDSGESWDFVDRDDHLVRKIAKSAVRAFEVTPDRRKPRPVEKDPYLDDLHFGTRVGDPIRRQP